MTTQTRHQTAAPGEYVETPCARETDLYLVELHPDAESVNEAAAARARELCQQCPIFTQCLTQALVGPPVSGFVAGTTDKDRRRMRRALKVSERRIDLDEYALGSGNRGSQVNYDRLAELLRRHPNADNATIASMADCSETSVKRFRSTGRVPKPRKAQTQTAPDSDTLKAVYARTVAPRRPKRRKKASPAVKKQPGQQAEQLCVVPFEEVAAAQEEANRVAGARRRAWRRELHRQKTPLPAASDQS